MTLELKRNYALSKKIGLAVMVQEVGCLKGNKQKQPPEVFCKKGVLKNFAKFKGKHLCQSLFFNKVAGPRPAPLLKKRLWHRCFPVNFAKFLRIPFLTEHLWWLLLACNVMKKRLGYR